MPKHFKTANTGGSATGSKAGDRGRARQKSVHPTSQGEHGARGFDSQKPAPNPGNLAAVDEMNKTVNHTTQGGKKFSR